jgi:RHS repeat-associated protein
MRAPSPSRSWARRRLPLLIGSVVCAGLVGTLGLSPAWAQGGDAAAPAAVVGDFALGDGAEGLIDERTGAVSLTLPVAAGLTVKWSSAAAGSNEDLLGPGWGWAGLGRVDVDGGVRVFPTSGVGVFDADASYDSGMAGYLTGDAAFAVADGEVLPARADGRVGERPYRFVMAELGGTRTYYSAEGRPIAQVDLHGNRTDYEWADQQLTRVVDPLGVVTELVWEGTRKVKVTSRAGEAGSTMQATLELSQKRIVGVVDPTGARTSIHYSGEPIDRIEGPSGAVTQVSWAQPALDGSVPVERVAVVDEQTNETLSARTWEGTGSATGWPAQAASATYETVVSDGQSRVTSKYASNSLLLERTLDVATAAGRQVMQEQSFVYPGTDGSKAANPSAPPANWTKPERAELVYRDAAGRERAVTGEYEYDGLGRPIKQIENDGTVMTTTYDDDAVPRPEPLPGDVQAPAIGLPVVQRTTAPDGLVTETKVERNDAGTAVVATESYSGRDGEELVRTARAEMTVEADGFISREVSYPQGGEGDPFVTEWQRSLDPVAGRLTLTQTDAAGTADAVRATMVTDLLINQPIEEIDLAGNRTLTTYDAAGREVARMDAAGRTTSTSYAVHQLDGVNATSVEAPGGVVATEERDAIGRVVRLTDNIDDGVAVEGHVRVAETREYLSPAVSRVTDAWGSSTTTTHDVLGRAARTEFSSGLVQIASYDDVAGTLTTGLSPTGELEDAAVITTDVLDERGQLIEQRSTRADGGATLTKATVRDGRGRVTSSSDGRSSNTVDFDAFGNLERSTTSQISEGTSSLLLRAEREYDDVGNSVQKALTSESDAAAGPRREIDALGRMTSRVDQAGSKTEWTYTPDGLVEQAIYGHGRVTTNTYETKTRALLESRVDSPLGESVRMAYEYDPVTGALLAVFDPADRDDTEMRYEYDAWGNTTRVTYPDGESVSHEFDQHGREIGMTDVAGNRTRYEHNETGLITRAVQTGPACDEATGADCEPIAEVSYEFDELWRVAALERGNGVVTRFKYTSMNQIASERTTDDGGAVIAELTYEYDVRGNVIERDETTRDEVGTLVHELTAYEYDAYGRLVQSSKRSGQGDTAVEHRSTYALTLAGDIAEERVVEVAGGRVSETVRAFEYSPIGELLAITTDGVRAAQAYDAAGNLIRAADGTTYRHNAMGQIVEETTDAATVHTTYWPDGSRRSLSTVDAETGVPAESDFYWDSDRLINEAHSSDEAGASSDLASYLFGATRHARTVQAGDGAAPRTSYLVTDRHGSTTHLTDDAGSVEIAYAYTDYGVMNERGEDPSVAANANSEAVRATFATTASGVGDAMRNPIQFAGELTDASGDQYLRTRVLHNDDMRFHSPDSEQLMTLFAFADLNPITKVDPSGRSAADDSVAWLTFGVGVAALIAGIVATAVTVATGGLAALGLAGGIAAAVDFVAGGYSVAIAAGQQIVKYEPEFVSEGAAAFFTSDAAIWSEMAVGAAAAAASFLVAKAVFSATAPTSDLWIQANWIADEMQARARIIGAKVSKHTIMKALNASVKKYSDEDALDALMGNWSPIRAKLVEPITSGNGRAMVVSEAAGKKLRAYYDAEMLAMAIKVDLDKVLTPMKRRMRELLIEIDPTGGQIYGRVTYTPKVTFIDPKGNPYGLDKNYFGRESLNTIPSWELALLKPEDRVITTMPDGDGDLWGMVFDVDLTKAW